MFGKQIAPHSLVFSLLLLLSCKGQTLPLLIDTLGSPADQTGYLWKPDMREFAPIVAVASVIEDNVLERNRVAARFPDVLLNLHRAKCRAEIIVKGTVDDNDFDLFYFTQSPDSPVGNPKYKRLLRIEPGKRYLLFLVREHGVLRTIGDVGEYAIQVIGDLPSGYVPPADLAGAAADILLQGGNRSNADTFSRNIESAAELVNRWGASRVRTIGLLRNLLNEPEPIRQAACQTLVDLYSGQFACLRAIRDDAQEAQDKRDWAAKTANLAKEWEALLIRDLKDDPAHLEFLKAKLPHPENRTAILEELESLLDSPNEAIQKGACNALKRYYPYAGSRCATR